MSPGGTRLEQLDLVVDMACTNGGQNGSVVFGFEHGAFHFASMFPPEQDPQPSA